MSGTQASFLDNLVTSVRDNPLAAALIGGGAFWLLAGNDKLKNAVGSVAAAASPIIDAGAGNLRAAAHKVERTVAPPTAPEMDHGETFRAGQAFRETLGAA